MVMFLSLFCESYQSIHAPCTFQTLVAGSNNTKISYYSRKISYFGNDRVYLTDNITENFVESMCGKKSAGWMANIYKKILMEFRVTKTKT